MEFSPQYIILFENFELLRAANYGVINVLTFDGYLEGFSHNCPGFLEILSVSSCSFCKNIADF